MKERDQPAENLTAHFTEGPIRFAMRTRGADPFDFAADVRPQELVAGLTVAVCTYKRAASLNRFLDSLAPQTRRPDDIIIVDASPDDETRKSFSARGDLDQLAASTVYFHVDQPLRGLTRQRNFALSRVRTEFVAFFDDDVVLRPSCLEELERGFFTAGTKTVGVGVYIENQYTLPTLLWRIRKRLRIVPDLNPGEYCRSGMSIPWSFLPPTDKLVEAGWLPGCGFAWRTREAVQAGFNEGFSGYCNGEDLEFSLKMKAVGKLFIAGAARLLHLHDESGRPNVEELSYSLLRNSYEIHRTLLPERKWRDAAYFIYAHGLDTILKSPNLFRPGRTRSTAQTMKGSFRFFWQLFLAILYAAGTSI